MTQATTPTTEIGKCVACNRTHRRQTGGPALWCTCRAGIPCDDRSHEHGKPGGVSTPDHPVTAIRWRAVKVTLTNTVCDARCQSARSDKCACSCAGRNHGASHA